MLPKIIYKTSYYFAAQKVAAKNIPLTPPFIICGIYRSGTTLTTSILEKMGIDLGPENHKFQGVGKLVNLNPEGFQEIFLMNDLGRYILHYLGGSGIVFPDPEKVSKLDLNSLSDADFSYYSEIVLDDDRIKQEVRRDILTKYGVSRLNQYFCDYFDTSFWGFKDVHCGVYIPVYLKMWPGSKFICVVRNPASFLKSAQDLSPGIPINTWLDYYQRILGFEKIAEIYWVIYENLLNKDRDLLQGLINFVKGKQDAIDDRQLEAISHIIRNPKYHADHLSLENQPEEVRRMYLLLQNKSQESIQKYRFKK